MKLRLKPLERSIRDRVREEVNASDLLRSEYERRRKSRWIDAWLDIVHMTCRGLIVLYGLVAGLWFSVFLLPLLALRSLGEYLRDDELLAAQSLVLFGGVCGAAGIMAIPRFVFRAGDVDAPALAFPVPDRRHLRRLFRERLFFLCFFALIAAPALGYLGWNRQFDTLDWLMTALCVASHLSIMCAMFFSLETRVVPVAASVALIATGLASMFTSIGVALKQLSLPWLVPAIFLVLPSGWINSALYHGWLNGDPTALWVLVPIGVAVAYLVGVFRRRFAIREFLFEGNDVAAVALEDGRIVPPQPRSVDNAEGDTRFADSDQGTKWIEVSLRNRLAMDRAWRQSDWCCRGWLDELIARWLSPRERSILECWHGPAKSYTREFYIVLMLVAMGAAVWLIAPTRPNDGPAGLAAFVLFWVAIMSTGIVALKIRMGDPFYNSGFPIRFAEPLRAVLRVQLLVLPFWLLPTALAARCLSLLVDLPLDEAVYLALSPAVYTIVMAPTGVLLRASYATRGRSALIFQIGLLAAWYLVASALVTIAILHPHYTGRDAPPETILWTGFALVSLITVLGWQRLSFLYHHRVIDLAGRTIDNRMNHISRG